MKNKYASLLAPALLSTGLLFATGSSLKAEIVSFAASFDSNLAFELNESIFRAANVATFDIIAEIDTVAETIGVSSALITSDGADVPYSVSGGSVFNPTTITGNVSFSPFTFDLQEVGDQVVDIEPSGSSMGVAGVFLVSSATGSGSVSPDGGYQFDIDVSGSDGTSSDNTSIVYSQEMLPVLFLSFENFDFQDFPSAFNVDVNFIASRAFNSVVDFTVSPGGVPTDLSIEDLGFDTGGGVLTFTAVPEPSSFFLLASGFTLLLYRRRS